MKIEWRSLPSMACEQWPRPVVSSTRMTSLHGSKGRTLKSSTKTMTNKNMTRTMTKTTTR